jgi:electron transfer flavoprotein beta subunit
MNHFEVIRMLAITCVKQVPDTTQVRIDPVTNTLVREGVPFIMNPFDTHALEESLRLKDEHGFRVVVISMGPPSAALMLRQAVAVGADEAVLLCDRAFAGADTLATSMVLSETIRRLAEKEEVGVVICGKQTIDGDTAQVGPGIATRLGYPQLTLVDQIESVDIASRRVRVRRRLEGRYERVEAPLPSLITVTREINRLRYPTVPGRLLAEEAAVTVWSNQDLQLDVETIGLKGSPTQVRRIFSPQRVKSEIVGGGGSNTEATAQLLIDKLLSRDILQ